MSASPYPHTPLPADAPASDLAMQPVIEELTRDMVQQGYGTKPGDLVGFQQVKQQGAAYQGQLALALAATIQAANELKDKLIISGARWKQGELLTTLMRGTLALSESDWVRLLTLYGLPRTGAAGQPARYESWWGFSTILTFTQLARHAKKHPLQHPPLLELLHQVLAECRPSRPEEVKVRTKIREILGLATDTDELPVVEFRADDALSRHLAGLVQDLDRSSPSAGPWLRLWQLWQRASGGQPTGKYAKEIAAEVAALGPDNVREQGRALLITLTAIRPAEVAYTTEYQGQYTEEQLRTWYGTAFAITPQGYSVTRTDTTYLPEPTITVAKGLIWTLAPLLDAPLVGQLADFAARSYQKIPGRGPLAAGLGNAALWALAQAGLPGVSALARVRGKIRQSNTQTLIAKYIEQESAKLGVSPAEVEDLAAPDAGLTLGTLHEELGEYAATLTLREGRAELGWTKAGKPLKSAPAALKASHPDKLQELKLAQTTAQQTYTAQRDRLDRSFVEGRCIAWPWFEQYYFEHGLLSELARPLIWRLHHPEGGHHDALWLDGAWRDALGQPVPAPIADTQLQLWHPVLVPAAEVLAWRQLLETKQLRQPLKQTFREVYVLTPPEERTRTYSNRMAAHVLKQHQFNSLAKLRGWRYSLLGAYDKGYENEAAVLPLPALGLQAEFWVSEVNADGAWNDTGIYNYVSTDQIRFVRPAAPDAPVPLPEVDPLVFSEVMRDVDLFVGVASVGNDPLWRDQGGLAQFRNYWESYSFGELTEVAKTRKLALERLVPRLKIGRVSELKGNFLHVRGHRHVYKIHLGSGNILMEPSDRYLCIVPDRSARTLGAPGVFLPFEGDAVLSIILSKAALLMDDDQITDETILRQL
ncbi:DUF4132 domain-containing protein [Hymenobacter sp. RP-2-7]|uniref:DUF4132 domain-containing protein n=1 Tax=Hymenobacter polaris TaxID=2682546 RepID=A0A7Y0ABM9_9BACT|nr:DUF4132 domain-containing protein [Hymenobacter polaris]NML64323.1 DUF4132 domain-containing protein [Hymenobacter polaris]